MGVEEQDVPAVDAAEAPETPDAPVSNGSVRGDLEAAMRSATAREAPDKLYAGKAPPPSKTSSVTAAPPSGRDPQGRFAKPAGKAPLPPPTSKTSVPASTPAPQVEAGTKAPTAWKADIREKHWAALPPEVQQEVIRRENDAAQAFSERHQLKQQLAAWQQVYSPYEAMFRAENGSPLKGFASYLQTAAALRTAPPAHKGRLIASIIDQFAIPLEMVNAHLAGADGRPNPNAPPEQRAPAQYKDPRVDQLLSDLQQAKQYKMQETQTHTHREMQEFAKTHDFLEDVKDTMADFLETASRRNVALSLDDAYARAVQMHPEIATIVRQRQEAEAAKNAQASTQRAVGASSSVRGAAVGGPPQPQRNGSIRDDLMAAMQSVQNR